jgi:hypothetical protein
MVLFSRDDADPNPKSSPAVPMRPPIWAGWMAISALVNRLRKKVPAPPRHGVGERLIRGHCSQRTNVSRSGVSRFLFARRRASEGNRLAFSAPC